MVNGLNESAPAYSIRLDDVESDFETIASELELDYITVAAMLESRELDGRVQDMIKNETDLYTVIKMKRDHFSSEQIFDVMNVVQQQGLSAKTTSHMMKLMKEDPKLTPEEALGEIQNKGMPTKVTVTFDAEWNTALIDAVTEKDVTKQEYVREATMRCLINEGFYTKQIDQRK